MWWISLLVIDDRFFFCCIPQQGHQDLIPSSGTLKTCPKNKSKPIVSKEFGSWLSSVLVLPILHLFSEDEDFFLFFFPFLHVSIQSMDAFNSDGSLYLKGLTCLLSSFAGMFFLASVPSIPSQKNTVHANQQKIHFLLLNIWNALTQTGKW